MASPFPSRANNLLAALRYSDHFDYPLTLDELWFWQIATHYSRSQISQKLTAYHLQPTTGYFHLPRRSRIVPLRRQRAVFSRSKWLIAARVGKQLSRIPTIQAIFVTGALAMDNSPRHDDIDFMIVTSPHTLWLTRPLVILLLHLLRARRPTSLPEHSSPRVSGKICDNLYLDTHNLSLTTRNLYVAHELLQARAVFDRSHIHGRFLGANAWARKYLPVAYAETLKNLKLNNSKMPKNFGFQISDIFLVPLNLVLFIVQYAYMFPKLTRERVSWGFAFFHPRAKIEFRGSQD